MGKQLQATCHIGSIQRGRGVLDVPDVPGMVVYEYDGAGRGHIDGESVVGEGDRVLSPEAIF